jgi:hypothetical protein
MTSDGKSICLASGEKSEGLCGSCRSSRLWAGIQTIDCIGPPAWRARASRSRGQEELPQLQHHGYPTTAGYKAIDTTKHCEIWHTVNVQPIRLSAAMGSTATGPTDATRNLTAHTLRDRDYCKLNSRILRAPSNFIGWRLENFRHLLTSSPRTHHLPEWRGRRLHVRQRCRPAPLPRSR